MKLIGKYKDYFDYLIHQYGVDEKLILDRRDIGYSDTFVKSMAHVDGHVKRSLVKAGDEIPFSGRAYWDNSTFRPREEMVDEWFVINGRGYPVLSVGLYLDSTYVLATDKNTHAYRSYWFNKPTYVSGTVLDEFVNLSKHVGRHAFIASYNRLNDTWWVKPEYQRMSDAGIPSIIDPQTMYVQTVDFIGEHFVKEAEVIAPMTSKEKIVAHGFDLKTSFRGKI